MRQSKQHPPSGDPQSEIDRCIREQQECRAYLAGYGPHKDGALHGLQDWLTEEILIRLGTANGKSTAEPNAPEAKQ